MTRERGCGPESLAAFEEYDRGTFLKHGKK